MYLRIMHALNILRLDLGAPLFYSKDDAIKPFEYSAPEGELLFCFALSSIQGVRIEPEADQYLGDLIVGGRLDPHPFPEHDCPVTLELPAGKYLFAQVRESLGREDFIQMAIEVQKEGLWKRLKPENRLYLRYLFEDGKAVTQVFRPYSEEADA
jgi:hypothetical protein